MAAAGATFCVEASGMERLRIGADPQRTRVVFRDASALEALLAGHRMALAEAYLHERVDVVGSFGDII